jgi:nucleotidyltransferase substrate binding protein (TIGR01987 family)
MNSSEDIRWKQRLKNFMKAFLQLKKFISQNELNELEKQGFIKCFEYNYELSWNTIKDFYESQGEVSIQGSRDAFRLAFNRGLIDDGELWMEMIKSRTLTAHTYNEETMVQILNAIRSKYFLAFQKLVDKLNELAK